MHAVGLIATKNSLGVTRAKATQRRFTGEYISAGTYLQDDEKSASETRQACTLHIRFLALSLACCSVCSAVACMDYARKIGQGTNFLSTR
jgi:hypothetical protein